MIGDKKTRMLLLVLLAITLVYAVGGGLKFTADPGTVMFFVIVAAILLIIFRKEVKKFEV